jgi:ABC-type nitrate/sulfonate/bicarbonate transport system substrate-binding protein
MGSDETIYRPFDAQSSLRNCGCGCDTGSGAALAIDPEVLSGFIQITCAMPLIMAGPMGPYAEQRLNVSLINMAGWALVRDHRLNGELDASRFLAPMLLAIAMGMGRRRSAPVVVRPEIDEAGVVAFPDNKPPKPQHPTIVA